MAKIMQLVDPKMLQQQVPAPVNPLHRSIATLDQDMQAILQRTNLSDEEKVRQYNQVLQRSLEYHDHLRAPSPAPPATTTLKDIEEEVLAVVPKQSMMKRKAQALLERIKRQPDMGWTERGELVFEGEVIKGSNIVDLVNDVLRNRKSFDHPHGWRQFARALRQSNVPRDLVGNRRLWDWMHHEATTSDRHSSEVEITPLKRERYQTPLTSRTPSIRRRLRKTIKKEPVSGKKRKLEPFSVKKGLKWDPFT